MKNSSQLWAIENRPYIRFTILVSASLLSLTTPLSAQNFYNLDFEGATGVPVAPGPQGWGVLNPATALPNWTALVGGQQVGWLEQNQTVGIEPAVILFGPSSWPVIEGNFSVGLRSGNTLSGELIPASVSQFGLIPSDAQSFQIKVYSIFSSLSVGLNGAGLSMQPIVVTQNYTLYAGDISQFAGQMENLTISVSSGQAVVDSIAFSPSPVPEPQSELLILLGLAGAVWGRTKRRC